MPTELGESITVDGIELGDLRFFARPSEERYAAFARLRAECPVAFHREIHVIEGGTAGRGFWSVVRHADVREVNRLARVFSSASGNTVSEWSAKKLEMFGSMIALDDPQHAKLRLLVQKGFTPREIARIEASIRTRTQALLSGVRERAGTTFDAVEHLAMPMPLQVICDMLGIPPADEADVLDWTNRILTPADPEFGGTAAAQLDAARSLVGYAAELGRDRLANPRDDIPSLLMHAEMDGERLTAQEFGSFFLLLATAGNETTRTAIAHALHEFSRHPDQRRAWEADFHALATGAADEIVRHANPVLHMRRTALVDTEIGGRRILAGDKVAMWYASANRDERVFDDPDRFDVRRPNAREQIGFGGGGPHFCLGANLARREIIVFFEELFATLPDLVTTAEPERMHSNFINGVKRLPCTFG